MAYFNLFSWPNSENRNDLALEHFTKAKANIENLALGEDVVFCLAHNADPALSTGLYVVYLVGEYYGRTNDDHTHTLLLNFFKQSGCPDWKDFESPYIGADLTDVDNFAARMQQYGVAITDGPVIKRVHPLAEVPAPAPAIAPLPPVPAPAAPAAPVPAAAPVEPHLAGSRTTMKTAWISPAPLDAVRQQLQVLFLQEGMHVVAEGGAPLHEIIVEQGSQVSTRVVGGWFVNAKSLPKRAVVRLKAEDAGTFIFVVIGETLGLGLLDPSLQGKYEEYFRLWIGSLMSALPPAGGVPPVAPVLGTVPAVPLVPIVPGAPGYVPMTPSVSVVRAAKSRSSALLLEILLGLIGLPGFGWIYAGRAKPGWILLGCFFVWSFIAYILVAVTAGVSAVCTAPIGIATVVTSSILLNKYMKANPGMFS